MPTVTTGDGASIAYETAGAGPSLLLVHGITDSHRAWDPLVPALADDYKVVAIDLRGHGASQRLPPYDALTMAGDVQAVAESVGAIEPLVVGHSLGGVVVSLYAASHPARGVVNVDQSLSLASFKDALASVEPLLRDSTTFPSVMEQIVTTGYGPLPELERARIEEQQSPEQDVVLGVWDLVLRSDVDALDEVVRTTADAITVPYLALHGDDPGDEYREWLRASLPTSTLEVWPDHGHFPHLVDPARFVERLHDFEHRL